MFRYFDWWLVSSLQEAVPADNIVHCGLGPRAYSCQHCNVAGVHPSGFMPVAVCWQRACVIQEGAFIQETERVGFLCGNVQTVALQDTFCGYNFVAQIRSG